MSNIAYNTTLSGGTFLSNDRDTLNSNLAQARLQTITTESTTATLAENTDVVRIDLSGGSFTLSLLDTPTDGCAFEIIIADLSANTLTVDLEGGASDTMEGPGVAADAFTMSTSQWEHVIVTYDAANTRWTKRDLA